MPMMQRLTVIRYRLGCAKWLWVHRYRDDNPPHDVFHLEIAPWAIRVGVMAADTRLRDSFVRIQGLKIHIASVHHRFRIWTIGMLIDLPQSFLIKLGLGSILFVDRPETDQSIANLGLRIG